MAKRIILLNFFALVVIIMMIESNSELFPWFHRNNNGFQLTDLISHDVAMDQLTTRQKPDNLALDKLTTIEKPDDLALDQLTTREKPDDLALDQLTTRKKPDDPALDQLTTRKKQEPISVLIQKGKTNRRRPWQFTLKKNTFGINVHTQFDMSKNFPIKWSPRIGLSALSNLIESQHLSMTVINNATKKPMDLPYHNCSRIYQESLIARYMFPRVHGICDGYRTSDISLLLQMDRKQTDYLVKLAQIATNWKGPISISLYYEFENASMDHNKNFFINDVEQILKKYDIFESTVCVHVVYVKQKCTLFPINVLRNVAMQFAPTDTILLSEVDFICPPNMDVTIRKQVTLDMLTLKKLYIVPVFGTPEKKYTIAANKNELVSQWNRNVTIPMSIVKYKFPEGHSAVDYDRFKTAKKMYQVNASRAFEPYYIVNRSLVPYYPEEFFWGYRDKNVHRRILGGMGWDSVILPDVFMVHTPHSSQIRRRNTVWGSCSRAVMDFLEDAARTIVSTS